MQKRTLCDNGLTSAQVTVQGARYPEHLQKLTGR